MNKVNGLCIKYSKKEKRRKHMNTILLIFFAIPLAVIIFSIALQKILKCPALVAGIIFAIGVIITFIIGNLIILVATLVYTFISYITALITCLICRFFKNNNHDENCCRRNRCCNNNGNGDLLTINSSCANGNTNNLLTISSNHNGRDCCCNNDNNNDCRCDNGNGINTANTINGVIRIVDSNGNNSCNNDEITTRINVVPNTTNNGRTGCICGRYRRR